MCCLFIVWIWEGDFVLFYVFYYEIEENIIVFLRFLKIEIFFINYKVFRMMLGIKGVLVKFFLFFLWVDMNI